MREFQLKKNSSLAADALGGYGYFDQERLAEKIEYLCICQEKDIAKHFPGQHWNTLQMNLTEDFKKKLTNKAESIIQKKAHAGPLTWMLAKKIAQYSNPSEEKFIMNINNIPDALKNIIEYAKTFVR